MTWNVYVCLCSVWKKIARKGLRWNLSHLQCFIVTEWWTFVSYKHIHFSLNKIHNFSSKVIVYIYAPSHYLNLSWLIIKVLQWHSVSQEVHLNLIQDTYLKIVLTSKITYMCHWIGSALVQIMAWCLFSNKPLSKPMLGYWQLDS